MRKDIEPTCYYFQESGSVPNSKFPLLRYQNVFAERDNAAAEWLERTFAINGWTNSWRWGIYDFHHYHSNTHEVLGVFKGSADVQVGGEQGKVLYLSIGDVVVIPAGVAHKCISHSDDFTVVGAYPDGAEPDMIRISNTERSEIDRNIAATAIPATDPVRGESGGLRNIWQ